MFEKTKETITVSIMSAHLLLMTEKQRSEVLLGKCNLQDRIGTKGAALLIIFIFFVSIYLIDLL